MISGRLLHPKSGSSQIGDYGRKGMFRALEVEDLFSRVVRPRTSGQVPP